LVVCPASLLRQWESEVESKVARHKLTVCVHHGNNRETKGKHLRTYDIVVTTYQIVAREHKNLSAVFGVKWRRIILDEAHVVRNHKSQSSLAVSDLRGKYRWALTGTPIQNKELDVYALLKFLRCSPFDDLHTWKKWIDNKSAGGQNRLNLLMKSLMLRRTKAQLRTDEEASHNKENMSGPPFMRPSRSYSPRSSAGAPVVKTTKNLSQPTIQAALKQRTSPSAPRRSRVKSEDQKVVSQVVYEEEIRKLAEKRVQLSDAEKLFEKVAHKLPDRGSQIKKRIDVLRQELEGVTQYVSELKVEPSKVPAIKVVKPAFKAPIAPSVDGPDWDELSAAVHQIQPVYTGAQGMATFNNQKALTLESLKVG